MTIVINVVLMMVAVFLIGFIVKLLIMLWQLWRPR